MFHRRKVAVESFLDRSLAAQERRAWLRRAIEAHVDPATLEPVAWTGAGMLTGDGLYANDVESPCAKCGHPRWAHADSTMFDGPCALGCPECDLGTSGYGPSRPKTTDG